MKIAVLGSTGSIGLQTLDVCRRLSPRPEIAILSAHSSSDILMAQADIHPDEIMMSRSLYSSYATLMWLDNVQEIPPFRVLIPPEEMNSKWITIRDIEKIRGY